jgi:hypothetical protein
VVEGRAAAKKIVARLGLLATIIIISGLLIGQYQAGQRDNSYVAAVLEKDRLIRTTPSPKIILVGGSNIAFGIDSKAIQDSLGMSVVNMGLYAKLGLKYMLVQVQPYIRPGDVVIVIPEYDQFFGDYANGDNTLSTALRYAPPDRIPDFIRSYSIIDVVLRPRVESARRAFLEAAAAAVGMKDQFFPSDTNTLYNRNSFNRYGDVVAHLGKKGANPDSIFVKPLPPMKDFNLATLDELNGMEAKASEERAHAYFMFPSYIDRSYKMNVAAIDSLRLKLSGSQMPIVGTATDFVYPGRFMFDSRYHLNSLGREIRTRKMIALLRRRGVSDGWYPRVAQTAGTSGTQ